MSAEPSPSPFHAGELAIQRQLGVAERVDAFARKAVRDHMPDQHRTFFAQLPFLVAASVDRQGDPAVTLLAGRPGFAHSPDAGFLQIDCAPDPSDPVAEGWVPGEPVGLLGIELRTRRRNRMNGTLVQTGSGRLGVAVGQSFGNCPQYIHTRSMAFVRDPAQPWHGDVESGQALDEAARRMIAGADLFFVGSHVERGERGARSVDASHRGGKPGFVRIRGNRLSIPDFAGNLHFNTLGNFLLNPRAGLVFVDFATGDMLHLSGDVLLDFGAEEAATFQGAERLWHVDVRRWTRRKGAFPLRGRGGEASPNALMTGSWEESDARREAERMRGQWRDFRIAEIVQESSVVKSFWLEPVGTPGPWLHQAGQYLPVRLKLPGDERHTSRVYTVSAAPSDSRYRISVRRQGAFSTHLHDHCRAGDTIQAQAPRGGFVVDALQPRPLVLISAGIGITPMVAMLRHVVYEGVRKRRVRPTWFIHGSRSVAERAFAGELQQLAEAANGAVRVVQVLSDPGGGGIEGRDYHARGRVDLALLQAVLPFGDFDFHLCGPPDFMQSVYTQLRGVHVPNERIHAEAFGPAGIRRDDRAGMPPAATGPVQVLFARSGKEARWTPGAGSLLDLAEARGLAPPYACRSGTCGSCRQVLAQGSVTYPSQPQAPCGSDELLLCQALPMQGSEPLVIEA
ncbi:pyridoxamine 5'-phosphate oxidase family protein [Luteimonas sp. RD2P54]|uniref:Pyridoxamine 5'-phosphate oxidase family protein n=1 Tax=Luteimonas endophytica TaxID=3042023 RepID=A0ABT6J9R7_9GAMM|nr:pyridoxamine 5'-phosphate oxidase family protein [Luteimonas endophytica]MDH5823569.1 pyridoxamine 5'-phosphate oxidase family protein [Luteimonas endophytica]